MSVKKFASDVCSIRCIKQGSIFLALFLVGLAPVSVNAFDLYLGTGVSGTFSHFTGRMLCRVINSDVAEVNCVVTPGSDDISNLTNTSGWFPGYGHNGFAFTLRCLT